MTDSGYPFEEAVNKMSMSPEETYAQAMINLAVYRLAQREIPQEDRQNHSGEEEFDQKMVQLIRQRFRENGKKEAGKQGSLRIMRLFAFAVLLICFVLTTAFAVSREFRQRIINLYVQTDADSSEIEWINPADPVLHTHQQGSSVDEQTAMAFQVTWFPDETFEMVREISEMPFWGNITYESDSGEGARSITLDLYGADTSLTLDTEGMDHTPIRIAGREIRLFEKEPSRILVWRDESVYFVMHTEKLSRTEALLAAVSVYGDSH